MKLYEIDEKIRELLEQVDPETGELCFDAEALEELQLERDRKLEGAALACKELAAEARAIREEEAALAKRRRAKEAASERLKKWLLYALDGQNFETAKVKLSCRKGVEKADVDAEVFVPWALEHGYDDLLRYKEPEADKKAILSALREGQELIGCQIVRDASLTIR